MAKAVPVGTEIVEKIASREEVDPLDLDVPLYDAINADALEALTNDTGNRQNSADLRIEFLYQGYLVTVDGTGEITIDRRTTELEPGDPSDEGAASD